MQLLMTMAPSHHDSQGSSYGNDSWMGLGGYSQAGPPQGTHAQGEYPSYDYNSNPMPMEPYAMSRPPPYAAAAHSHMPPPLVMPQHALWPSMIANSNSYQTPILPAAPVQTPMSATSHSSDMTPTSAKATTSRRKLTDDERRLMCLEAENNPTMKQTQIGAKFNVERSTVSKILRQKDKYMKPQPKEEVTSPGKKAKVKLPDVEKTLAKWASNQRAKGIPITNEELRKQVLMFSAGRSDQQTLTSTAWLEKFKQKYLSGNDNRAGQNDDAADSSTRSETPLDNSPVSSDGLVSPPMSAIEELKLEKDMFDFEGKDFQNSPSFQQVLSGEFPNVSDSLMSPVSPELNRENTESMQVGEDTPTDLNFPRQRSQTLPQLAAVNSGSRPISSGRNTPGLPVRSMTNSFETKSMSVDPRQTMKRHKSVPDIHDAEIVRYSSMQPPPLPRSADISPISHPASPVPQDETIRALHTIKKLLEQRPDVAEPDDYVMIGKLMEKLKLLRSPTNTPILPGGMHAMEFLESPRVSKKRTMVEMSS